VAAEGVRENTRTRVIEMYEAGWKQVDIAKELKVTKGFYGYFECRQSHEPYVRASNGTYVRSLTPV
jgi:transcriptional regulator